MPRYDIIEDMMTPARDWWWWLVVPLLWCIGRRAIIRVLRYDVIAASAMRTANSRLDTLFFLFPHLYWDANGRRPKHPIVFTTCVPVYDWFTILLYSLHVYLSMIDSLSIHAPAYEMRTAEGRSILLNALPFGQLMLHSSHLTVRILLNSLSLFQIIFHSSRLWSISYL